MPKHKLENVKKRKSTTFLQAVKTIGIILLSILLVLGVSSYILVRSYIHKMNLVPTSKESLGSSLDESTDELVEEEESQTQDSPQEDINALEEAIRKNMEENSTPIKSDKNVINILLIGSDTRKTGEKGRSDSMILISINKKTKKLIATSLLRDIYLQIPGKNNNRLNAAYAYGGAELLMESIEQNFKIEIDRYISIDFFAFIDVVDAVGGVTLEVSDREIPVINNSIKEINQLTSQEEGKDCLTNSGTILLNGKQALGYSRNRYVGNNDFERTSRQRKVLEQIYSRVKGLGLLKLNDLMNKILPQVTTNLTEGEIISLILSLPKYTGYEMDQWSIPIENSYTFMSIRGMSVIGIDFEKNRNEIDKRIYGEK